MQSIVEKDKCIITLHKMKYAMNEHRFKLLILYLQSVKKCKVADRVRYVVEVTQNWSLEYKIMFAGRPKIGAQFVEFGARFWLPVGGFRYVKNRRPIW